MSLGCEFSSLSASRSDAPDVDPADRIGELWNYPETHAFAELLIDCEENRTLPGSARAVRKSKIAKGIGLNDAGLKRDRNGSELGGSRSG